MYKSIYIGGFPPIHSSQPREAMTQMSQAAAELQDSFAPQRLATLRRLVATAVREKRHEKWGFSHEKCGLSHEKW